MNIIFLFILETIWFGQLAKEMFFLARKMKLSEYQIRKYLNTNVFTFSDKIPYLNPPLSKPNHIAIVVGSLTLVWYYLYIYSSDFGNWVMFHDGWPKLSSFFIFSIFTHIFRERQRQRVVRGGNGQFIWVLCLRRTTSFGCERWRFNRGKDAFRLQSLPCQILHLWWPQLPSPFRRR